MIDTAPPNNLLKYIKNLPPHMGWGSITPERRVQMGLIPDQPVEVKPSATTETEKPNLGTIKIFGHLLDAIHRKKRDGCGRLWLLIRALDTDGSGRIHLDQLRHEICDPAGRVRCLSKKRLQQIIRAGRGLFWHRSTDGRWLYYHSEARVANEIGITSIRGYAVEIPIVTLIGNIQSVRAAFYNAFHSSRGDGYNNPITRRVMQDRGMREARTQRKYEALAQVSTRREFAIVGQYSNYDWKKAQYHDADPVERSKVGGPAFIFIDYKGMLGKNPDRIKRPAHQRHWHNIYIVRQIGNSYSGTLSGPKRGRGWTNHKISHLCQSMPTLTGSADLEGSDDQCIKYYYDSDKKLRRAMCKEGRGEHPSYCPYPNFDYTRPPSSDCSFFWQEEIPWTE